MIKQLILFAALIANVNAFAQKGIPALECKYQQFIIQRGDTLQKNEITIWFSKDKIIQLFNQEGVLAASGIWDFTKEQLFMFGSGRWHDGADLKNYRKKVTLTNSTEIVNGFVANTMISTPQASTVNPFTGEQNYTTDIIYFDSATKIACYTKGDFLDFVDNGFGFLPIKTIRRINRDSDAEGKVIIYELQSKKERIIDETEWNKIADHE